jgi:hypothetical protein
MYHHRQSMFAIQGGLTWRDRPAPELNLRKKDRFGRLEIAGYTTVTLAGSVKAKIAEVPHYYWRTRHDSNV